MSSPLYYKLQDIEFWQHCASGYPEKVEFDFTGGLSIGKSYTTTQFAQAEKDITAHFAQKNIAIAIMNPLYQIDSVAQTVITIDILSDFQAIIKPKSSQLKLPTKFAQIDKLLAEHELRTTEVFTNGGDVSMHCKDGVFVSGDIKLRKFETEIAAQISTSEVKSEIIQLLKSGNIPATESFQWICKDIFEITVLIEALGNSQTALHQNLILRQLIPLIDKLTTKQKEHLIATTSELLRTSTPIIRNKSLSILYKMPPNILRKLNPDCQKFIAQIAKTRQLNCSYPAGEIIAQI